MLYVDQRWHGTHGIGRYAKEVTDRLRGPHVDLPVFGSPSSPFDVLAPGRIKLTSRDVIYSPGYNAGLTRATQLVTLHDLIHLQADGARAKLLRLYYERVVKPAVIAAGAVFTVSSTSENAIRKWLGGADVEILNVGNGCSDVFEKTTQDGTAPDYFLYVGNLKPHKNFDVLLQSLLQRPQYRLVAVINDRAIAEEKIRALGLTSRVKIVAGLSDAQLANYYQRSIALLIPSLVEGFGLPAVESLSCGRPVAYSSGCLSVAEIVGNHGVAVHDAASSARWADAMDELTALSPSFRAPSDSWRDQYRWNQVATKVNSHLSHLQNV